MVNCLNENEPRSYVTAYFHGVTLFSAIDPRRRMLCTTPVGARVCITLLDRMVTLFDAVEPSDGAKAFDIGYVLFTPLKTLPAT
jgi:ataxin-10